MEKMATHSSTLARIIPRTEEPGRLQSTGSQRVWHTWSNWVHTQRGERGSFVHLRIKRVSPVWLGAAESQVTRWNHTHRSKRQLHSDLFGPTSVLCHMILELWSKPGRRKSLKGLKSGIPNRNKTTKLKFFYTQSVDWDSNPLPR